MRQPNILLLVGEDVGFHLGCCGEPYADTPHLDQLAREGTLYTNMISTAPVCAPARSSLVSGRYPWSLGTLHMRSTLAQSPRLFTHELRAAGYHVSWPTKTDFNFDPPDDFADSREDWMDALRSGRLPEQPWLLFRNFAVTHESTMWDRSFSDGAGQRASRLNEQHILQPEQRHDPAVAPVPPYLPDDPAVRDSIARFHDALSIQDQQIGEALDALANSPYAENTVVIYTSDHGRGLAREKRWCYNGGIHVPLIVRTPDHSEPGRPSDRLVSTVDLPATMLSLAGVQIPDCYEGQAFLGPAAGGERDYVFSGRDRMDEAYDHVRAVRNKRWHYVHNGFPNLPYAQRNRYMERMPTTQILRERHAEGRLADPATLWMQARKPTEELYDAQSDPHMIRNLADKPESKSVLEEMRAALRQHQSVVNDLGLVPERELIERGIVTDRLGEYAQRIQPLPERHQIGPERTILERESAQAYEPDTDTSTEQ